MESCPHGRGLRYLMSADSRKPAIITAPTIKHLRMNRIFLFAPFTMDSLPGVPPLRQRRQYCQHERHAHCVRFILLSFRPPFLCRSHPIEYTYIIPKRQNNASGICGFAYKVIYIKRRFFLCSFHKNRLRHRTLYCVVLTKIENTQTFFSQPFCTNFVLDCTNSRFYLLFTLTKKQSGYYRLFSYYNVPVK